ncbi:hypothetical protein [Streptomyces sp. 6N223]|uniref:hypothetical protein n=1 Tax=Streptomyces sp. 6N223 TaxID=3457412 RepID=UPI003FD3B697
MAYEPGGQEQRQRQGRPERRAGGGVPDGLLVGGVALLASLAALTWTSTGLGGVVAHGSWPENVSFVRTGTALRSFLTDPRDVAGAWPATPPEQLSSATVLWLVFLTQVVMLFSTALLIAIQVARWRAKRHAGREHAGREKQAPAEGLRPSGSVEGEGADGGRVALEPEVPTGQYEAPSVPGSPHGPGGAGRSPAEAHAAPGRDGGHGRGAAGPHPSGPDAQRTPGAAGTGDPYAPEGAGWQDPRTPAAYGTHGAPGDPAAGGPGGLAPGWDGHDGADAGAASGSSARMPVTPGRGGRQGPAAAARDVVGAVVGGPEGLVVVDPDGRLWAKTARQRGKVGPVHVYDPGHVTDAPVRLRWAPQRGCGDMDVARRRAAALLAAVRPTEPIFQLDAEAAETLLRCYLHAAALAGESIQHVLRWANHGGNSSGQPGQAGKILRTHARATPGASMELESTLTTHPGRRDAALDLIARALGGLEQLHIRQSCSPGRVDTLALDNVAGEGGTLYVVGDQKETAALRHALVDAVTADQPSLTVIE